MKENIYTETKCPNCNHRIVVGIKTSKPSLEKVVTPEEIAEIKERFVAAIYQFVPSQEKAVEMIAWVNDEEVVVDSEDLNKFLKEYSVKDVLPGQTQIY